MSNKTKGDNYEDFVAQVYNAVLVAEASLGKIHPISLERKKVIISLNGTPSEIDIYWEYSIAGITQSVAIECKNFNRNVDLPKIRDFAHKIQSISGLKGVMVTKKGFSDNVKKFAKAENIELIVIREQNNDDWDGYIREICIKGVYILPSRFLRIQDIIINRNWLIDQGFSKGDTVTYEFNARNDHIIIEDRNTEFKYSLHKLQSCHFFQDTVPGVYIWTKQFQDGWIHTPDSCYKIDLISIQYYNPDPIEDNFSIDFGSCVLAVMEFVNRSEKCFVMRDGEQKYHT
jgi:hypothetical protein